MRKSILTRLIVSLSLILLISTGGSAYFAARNVRQIVEGNQIQLFKEKISTIVRILESRVEQLNQTGHPEAYLEDFQKAALRLIQSTYYTSVNLAQEAYPVLIGSDAKIILHPFMDNPETLGKAGIFLREAARTSSADEYIILNSKETLGVVRSFAPWAWQVGYVIPARVMFDGSDKLQSILFWTLLTGLLAALVVIFITVSRLVQPLKDLRGVADTLAAGDYSQSFSDVFSRKDEIGSLAGSLERMRAVIEARIAELKGTNIALLDEMQARKEAEALRLRHERDYQEIFNATSEAIIIFDAEDWTILHVNKRMVDLFGYTLEKVVGQKMETILRDNGTPVAGPLGELINKALAGAHQIFEWRIKKEDGGYLWVEISLRSSTIGDKRCILSVLRDVGERKLAERDRARMEEQLRHVQKMEAIGTLAGGIAHDFNNILTPLLGYAEMLILQLDPESEQQREAREIYSAAQRARSLVQRILTISRKGDMTLKPLAAQKEVEEAVSLVKASLPKNITTVCNIDDNCGLIMAEPGQVHQIVMNLSTNAYHAMKESGGELTISINGIKVATSSFVEKVSLKPGRYVRLTVSDTGCGIPAEIRKNIFDPYYTTKVAGQGTGLGLSIIHGIVKSLCGHITVESEMGRTVFTVYIPCVHKNLEVSSSESMDELQKGFESIMLVDDERSILEFCCTMLESLGYSVRTCNSSAEGLETFIADPGAFDLVVTDMTMPGFSGFELSRKLKEIRPDIPIILVTGFSDIINKDEAHQVGIYAIMTKPIDMGNFSRTLREALVSGADGSQKKN